MDQPVKQLSHPRRVQNAQRASGFVLNEILIAIGIFAIGMVALASLFPVAALLQRETAEEVFAESAAKSAKAIVEAKTLTYRWTGTASTGDLAGYYAASGYAHDEAVSLYTALGNNTFYARYPASVRSYPQAQLKGTNVSDCDLFWIPFIQDISGDPALPKWVMRVFVVRGDSQTDYTVAPADRPRCANPNDSNDIPKVFHLRCSVNNTKPDTFVLSNAGHGIEPGDVLMDSNGNPHVASTVSGSQVRVMSRIPTTPGRPTKLWFAPRYSGTESPAQRVVTVQITPQP